MRGDPVTRQQEGQGQSRRTSRANEARWRWPPELRHRADGSALAKPQAIGPEVGFPLLWPSDFKQEPPSTDLEVAPVHPAPSLPARQVSLLSCPSSLLGWCHAVTMTVFPSTVLNHQRKLISRVLQSRRQSKGKIHSRLRRAAGCSKSGFQ